MRGMGDKEREREVFLKLGEQQSNKDGDVMID